MEVKENVRVIRNARTVAENKTYYIVKKVKDILNTENTKNKSKNIKHFFKIVAIEAVKLFTIFSLMTIMQCIINENELSLYVTLIENIKYLGTAYSLDILHRLNIIMGLNILVSIIIYTFIRAITNKKRMSLAITASVLFLYEIANYVVTDLRGSAITIADMLSLRTALNVSNGLSVKLSVGFIMGIVVYLIILLLIFTMYRKKQKMKKQMRAFSFAISLIILVLIINSNTINEISIWNVNDVYSKYGTNLTLVRMLKDLHIKPPQGYSKEEIENELKMYNVEDESNNEDVNVVIIMNESFTDYTNCEYLDITEDNIPFFHSLQNSENVISGIMHSDAFGGSTANIEYETLTQNTVAFLPEGAIPYQQYVTGNIDSIVDKMNNLNYTTHAIHAWYKSGYNRPKVYNLMGFDTYKFKEDYDDLEYDITGYTTDECAYSKIIEQFERKETSEKIFSFNVTMQNHMPYSKIDDQAKTYSEKRDANSYLQRQNKSDKALKKLVEYFNSYDEKVIILFFGDHQPYLGISEIKNDEENKYKVPYLIWANYDIETKEYGDTSANFLQSILIETANLPRDEYTNYMIELRKEIPVITANYYMGNNGIKYNLDDSTSPYYDKILKYKEIVYYKMFDNK